MLTMWKKTIIPLSRPWRYVVRGLFICMIVVLTLVAVFIVSLLRQIQFAVETITEPPLDPFPLGVNPATKEISPIGGYIYIDFQGQRLNI